jgi:hypothetical protein
MAGGTGLGLYSLRKRMDALSHGRCGVDSRADGQRGSEFWFEFEYRPDSADVPDEDEAAAAFSEQSRGVQFETADIALVSRPAHSHANSAARSMCDTDSVSIVNDASTRLDHAAYSAAAVLTAEHVSSPVLAVQFSDSSIVAHQPPSSSSAPSRRRRSMRQHLRANKSACGSAVVVADGSVDMGSANTPSGSSSLRILIGMSSSPMFFHGLDSLSSLLHLL